LKFDTLDGQPWKLSPIPRRGKKCSSKASIPDVEPTHLLMGPGSKRPGRVASHRRSSSAEVRRVMCLHDVQRDGLGFCSGDYEGYSLLVVIGQYEVDCLLVTVDHYEGYSLLVEVD
jgi:hypothetical protein